MHRKVQSSWICKAFVPQDGMAIYWAAAEAYFQKFLLLSTLWLEKGISIIMGWWFWKLLFGEKSLTMIKVHKVTSASNYARQMQKSRNMNFALRNVKRYFCYKTLHLWIAVSLCNFPKSTYIVHYCRSIFMQSSMRKGTDNLQDTQLANPTSISLCLLSIYQYVM